MVRFLGWVNYNPNFIYLNQEKGKCTSLPMYYMCGNTAYKIEDVDHINSFTNQIFYRGVTVDSNNACVTENTVFKLPEDKHTINEKLFNRIYNKVNAETVNSEEFPKYFCYPDANQYIKALKLIIDTWDNKEAYIGTTVNTEFSEIFADTKVSLESIKRGTWVPCSKEEYENALNKVISKIK